MTRFQPDALGVLCLLVAVVGGTLWLAAEAAVDRLRAWRYRRRQG